MSKHDEKRQASADRVSLLRLASMTSVAFERLGRRMAEVIERQFIGVETGITYEARTGDWGSLPNEPCRYCRQPGGVRFLIDDGPEGVMGLQPMSCTRCGRSWVADSATA